MHAFEGEWCFVNQTNDGFLGADAVIILTEWGQYSRINWDEVSSQMRKPAWIFDARSVLRNEDMNKNDLNFWRIGDGYEY